MRIKGSLFCTFLLLCSVAMSFASCSKDEEYEDYLDGTIWMVKFLKDTNYSYGGKPLGGEILYFHDGKGEYYYIDQDYKVIAIYEMFDSYRIINEKHAEVVVNSAFGTNMDGSRRKVDIQYSPQVLYYNGRDVFERAVRSKSFYFD